MAKYWLFVNKRNILWQNEPFDWRRSRLQDTGSKITGEAMKKNSSSGCVKNKSNSKQNEEILWRQEEKLNQIFLSLIHQSMAHSLFVYLFFVGLSCILSSILYSIGFLSFVSVFACRFTWHQLHVTCSFTASHTYTEL